MKNIDVYLVVVFLIVFIGLGYYVISDKNALGNEPKTINENVKPALESVSPKVSGVQDEHSELTESAESADGMSNVTPKAEMTLQDKLNFQKPEMQIDKNKKYFAKVKTTEGDFTIELFADKTPITVNNFVALSKSGFYNDIIFHRIIKGFMIQTGDPVGNGTGGPDYKFDDEPFDGKYTKGIVAMANSGPNTNGSQFFVMHENNELPLNYVIFGKVTEGLDVIDKIAITPVEASANGELSKPINPPKILSVEITEE